MPDRKKLCVADQHVRTKQDYLFPSEKITYQDAPQHTMVISNFSENKRASSPPG
jgi:hypothetical protein